MNKNYASIPQPCPASEPARAKYVELEMSELGQEIDNLIGLAKELQQRLTPVLDSRDEKCGEAVQSPEPSMPPLPSFIREHRKKLRTVSCGLNSLIRNLEI